MYPSHTHSPGLRHFVAGSLNITLLLQGTDYQNPANWSVVNASLLQARSPWLRLPQLQGAPAVSTASTKVLVPVVVSATGLRESAVPYLEAL